jgi:hypothetical protein
MFFSHLYSDYCPHKIHAGLLMVLFVHFLREHFFGPLFSRTLLRDINIRCAVSSFRQDHNPPAPYFRIAPINSKMMPHRTLTVGKRSYFESGQERRMAGQYAELAFTARRDDFINVFRPHHLPAGCHDFKKNFSFFSDHFLFNPRHFVLMALPAFPHIISASIQA